MSRLPQGPVFLLDGDDLTSFDDPEHASVHLEPYLVMSPFSSSTGSLDRFASSSPVTFASSAR